MKSGHHLPPERAIFAPPNQINSSYMGIPGAEYAFGYPSTPLGHEHSAPPFRGIEFQPSKLCPRNFIIFDQTDFQSRVMFHPAIAPKFAPAGVQNQPPGYVDSGFGAVNEDKEVSSSSPNEEDSDEIDALMSLDDDCEEYDEDEMSTARTNGNYGCRSPDSCSNYGPPKLKRKSSGVSSLDGSRSSSCSSGTKKKQKMKKMVKALRGIVPGGERMSSATLLDEAVKYLKSLKVEAQKLGDVKN